MSAFVSFARAHGLILDYASPDGRWHRTATEDKQRKKNGAYLWDGQRGVVKNFATMSDYAAFRDGSYSGRFDKATLRARQAVAEAEKKARQTEARKLAEDMLKRATLAEHPYLSAKGFPDERGLVLDGELLIPMREFALYRQLNSLQRIAADGTKLFLPGGKAKGSVFFIGPRPAHEKWFCEGFADGLTLKLALAKLYRQALVIVCFSAGNLEYVAKLCGSGVVYADNDESHTGQRAAEGSGLPWVMSDTIGNDANDDFLKHGIRYVCDKMRSA